MTDTLNNLFASTVSQDNIIDKKRLEKNIDKNNKNDKNDNKENESSIGSRILTGILILATVIFCIIFIVLITSNLSFLITCGRVLTAVGKDGKKRTFNDLWFPSYYFYQENNITYPFCQGLKLDQNGYLKGGEKLLNGISFSTGLPIEKYKFDFFTWFTRLQAGMAEGIIKTFMEIIIDFFNYFKAVSEKTTVINNARILDLLQIIEYIIPKNSYYRNLILFIIGLPLMLGIVLLSGFSSSFVYIYNLLTTSIPFNLLYLLFLSLILIIVVNFFFPFIFLIPFEVIFFPITGIVYASLLPIAFISVIILLTSYSSLIYNIITMLKLMFIGYFAGGYKAISKNAQENKNMYMFFVGLILIITLISIII
jgi:hypothetical protein